MAQFPFRNPVDSSDNTDEEQWKPPNYAESIKESSSDGEWKPPSYAEPVKGDEEKKPSIFKRVWDKASEPLTDAPSRFAKTVSNYINPKGETKGIRGVGSAYLESLGNVASSLTSPINLGLTAAGFGEAAKIPGASFATKALSAPVAAEGAKTTYEGIRDKDFTKTVLGAIEAYGGASGLKSRVHETPKISELPKEELPIRQSKEIPYKATSEWKPPEYAEPVKINEKPIPTRSPNLAADFAPVGDEESFNKNATKSVEDLKYDLARNKFNMGRDIPEELIKKSEEPTQKADFVNPFEKKADIRVDASKLEPAELKQMNEFMDSFPDIKGKDLGLEESDKPTAIFKGMQETGDPANPEMALYDIKGGTSHGSTVSAEKLKELGIDIPETPQQTERMSGEQLRAKALADKSSGWKPPSYASEPIIEHPLLNKEGEIGIPESLHPQLTGLKNYGDGVLHLDFDKTKPVTEEDVKALFEKQGKNVNVTEMYTNDKLPSRFRVDIQGDDPVHSSQLGDEVEKSVGGSFEKRGSETGAIKTPTPEPIKGPYGPALDKLFSSMGKTLEQRVQQDIINKSERAKRFAAFSSVKQEGMIGAKKSLSTLRGEFEKVDPEKLLLKPKEADTLFTAVKRAKITEGEKARGYTALFKLLNGDVLPARNELRVLDDVFGNGFASKIVDMHGGIGAVGLKLSKLANTMKSLQNSISLAAPLRHGIGLVARKEFYPAFADMFKFFAQPEFYKSSMQALEERPNYMLGRESGLFLSKPSSMLGSEEEFLNSYTGNIPVAKNVVGASQRAYTGFLNKLRADTFDSMIKQAKSLGYEPSTNVGDQIIPSKETRAIANFINNATGRGDLGRLNKMTNELNMLLWSPRMISSRITMLTNPSIYTSLPKGMRLEGLKSLLGIAALGTAIDTLSAYGGAKVSTNILSTDFGKSRFGTKLIDPWGSFQQYVVGAARFLAGKTDSSTPTTRLKIAGNFLANKESPAASLAHQLLTAKKFTPEKGAGSFTDEYGTKTSVQSEIGKRFTPIFIQDLQDLATSEPDFSKNIGLDIALAGASAAGMEQSYPEPKQKGKLSIGKLQLR